MRRWLLILSLAACQNSSPAPLHEGIKLATTQSQLEQGMISTRFNFANQTDLWVRLEIVHLEGPSRMTLSLIDPSGHVFFDNDFVYAPSVATSMDIPGMAMNPVTVFSAKPIPGGWALDQPIAIAGTMFTRYPQPGIWTVQAKLEGRMISSSSMNVDFTY
jgi:hypothetical protein